MASDDSEIDSPADEADRTDTNDDPRTAPEPPDGGKWGLPERLSRTVPDRRSYGLERVITADDGGLLSPRERQYVKHADKLDPPDRTAVEDVLVDRVDEFVEREWPMIRESYPDVAAALRDDICGEVSR